MTKRKFYLTKMAYLAVLIALSVVFNAFIEIQTPITKLTFSIIPSTLAGVFFGPISGFAVGFIGDLLGCIIAPKGAIFPTILISSGLFGAIPGVFCMIKKGNIYLKLVVSMLIAFVVCSVFINTLTFWVAFNKCAKSFWVYLGGRMISQTLNSLMNIAIVILVYAPLHKLVFSNLQTAKLQLGIRSF